ncbi:MAG: helix-turn-helix domain-containing protein [Bacteroidales bacterium]
MLSKDNQSIKKFGVREQKGKEDYLQNLIDQGENQQLDFKFEISDSRKIARTLAAFANTDGGKLLVGVKDNGAIAGVRSEEEYYMVEAASTMYCQPQIAFHTKEYNIQGRMVLEISVEKSQIKHKAPDKNNEMKYYVRVADQNLLAHSVQIRVWKLNERNIQTMFSIGENEYKVFNFLQLHKTTNYDSFRAFLPIPKRVLDNILAHLIYFGVISALLSEKDMLLEIIDPDRSLDDYRVKKRQIF